MNQVIANLTSLKMYAQLWLLWLTADVLHPEDVVIAPIY